ncbi:remorin-like isoform X1 [Wolffia australiana]
MGEGETKDLQAPASSAELEATKDVSVIPTPVEEKPGKTEAPTAAAAAEDKASDSSDRDAALARVETEKRISLAKAWEENEKTIIENRSHKELSAITSWENTKKAGVDAELKKYEEYLEKKKAEYAEKMKNKVAQIHKDAEEKRAAVEAKKGQALLHAEEQAAKFREKGFVPKKILVCFGS